MSVNLFTKARAHFNALIVGSPKSDGGVTGAGGTVASPAVVYRIGYYTVAVAPTASLLAQTVVDVTATVYGVKVGDIVTVAAPAAIEAGLVWDVFVSAADTVTFRVANPTASTITTISRTWFLEWCKFTAN